MAKKIPAVVESTTSVMSTLLSQQGDLPIPKINDTIEGIVVGLGKNEVLVDVNGFMTGVVRGPELFDESGDFSSLKLGDSVSTTVLEIENENGQVELSFRQAGHRKAWDALHKLQASNELVDAQIIDANKGGLIVRVGRVGGFLPVSQLSVEHYPRVEGGNKAKILERLSQYTNQLFKVKVIDVNEEEEKLIVSEKVAKADQQQEKIAQYKVGDVVEGKVTGVVDFGAFVEFGDNLEGLVHISEIAWQRIDSPKDFIKVGDPIKAEIISIDNSKISLSIRKLIRDPWLHVAEKYKIGAIAEGKVLKINPFGAFVELDAEIHGLVHISEISYRKLSSPLEVLQIGSPYKFKVISVEPHKHRLGLSYKVLNEQPAPVKAETKPVASEPTAPADDSVVTK